MEMTMESNPPVARNDNRWHFVEWSPIMLGAFGATALSSVLLGFGVTVGLGVSSTAPTWRDASAALAILSGLYLILQAILSFGLGGYLAGRLRAAGATVARATVAKMLLVPGYLPFVSTLCFSSSFIFLMVGSRLASPVVWVVVLGGLAFGKEDCPVGVLAGRVAVAAGDDVV
jgi:hypothetical protein